MADDNTLSLEDLNLVDTDAADAAAAAAEAAKADEEAKAAEAKAAEEEKVAAEAKAAEEEAAKKKGDEENTAWRDTITDEKQRKTADRYNSVGDLAQAVMDLRGGADKMIKPITDDSTDEEIAAHRKAVGAVEEGYEYSPPDEVELTEADQAVIDLVIPVAQENHIPKAMFEVLANKLVEANQAAADAYAEGVNGRQDQSMADLRKNWGDDFTENETLAHRVGKAMGEKNASFGDFLNATIEGTKQRVGDHPVMMEFQAQIGRLTAEGGAIVSTEARLSAQEELNELNAKIPPGTAAYAAPAHQKKLGELYNKVGGEEPIVGALGRTH